MQRRSNAPKGIKDLFYETRVLTGREYTVTKFAKEVLGGAVDPVMLGYIEKGKRFPNEALVRRLGGVVTVESELGSGTVFKVTLPMRCRA